MHQPSVHTRETGYLFLSDSQGGKYSYAKGVWKLKCHRSPGYKTNLIIKDSSLKNNNSFIRCNLENSETGVILELRVQHWVFNLHIDWLESVLVPMMIS